MEYACPDNYHKNVQNGLHVLVCDYHKESKENQNLIEKFKINVIGEIPNLENFSKYISCYSKIVGTICALRSKLRKSSVWLNINKGMTEADVYDNAIFMLQTIEVRGQLFNLFFDSGCGDMVVRKPVVDCLEKLGRANLEVTGPITLSDVGDQMSVSEHGAYSIRLPLRKGREAILSGICSEKVTAEFPRYPLKHITALKVCV